MTKKSASVDALELLHATLAKELAKRIVDGTASASDLSVARQFLKDNNIDSVPTEGSPLDELRDSLPFPSTEQVTADGEIIN